jgi:hypothetical protein
MQFDLSILDAREMADIAHSGAVSMTGEFGGQPVITVTKQVNNPRAIGLDLSPVVPDPAGVHLRCFPAADIQIADADRGQVDHALLNLEALQPGRRSPPDPRTSEGGQTP